MRLPREAMRRWVAAVAIGTAALASVSRFGPARADERRAFCGKTVGEWVEAYRDRSGRDRWRAVWAFRYFGPDAKAAVPDLVDSLRRGGFDDRASKNLVIDALALIGPDAAPAVPLLAEEFRKEDFVSFGGPKHALVQIGAAAVPALIEAMENLDGDRRPCAAEALGEIGPPAKASVPALIQALRWEHPKLDLQDVQGQALQSQAVIALGRIGPAAAAAIPALNALFDQRHDDFELNHLEVVIALDKIGAPPVAKLLGAFPREGVAYELSWLGTKAKEAVPTLRRALTADPACIRVDAAKALAAIDPSATEAVPVLIDAIDHHPDEALDVPDALAKFGPAARSAIPSLIARLTPDGSDPAAVRALVRIDPEGRQCVPALIGALKQKDPHVVFAAAESLGLLRRRARASVPALAAVIASALDEDDDGCNPRVSAVNALVRIDPESPLVIPALIDALRCHKSQGLGFGEERVVECEWSAAEAAAKHLGSLGPRARAAVPGLIHRLRDRKKDDLPDTTTRAVALALGRIGPDAGAAIPILKEVAEDKALYSTSAVIALYQLAPNGKELAEKWLEKPLSGRVQWEIQAQLEGRAMLLGATGRTSLEADAVIREDLERLDKCIESADREGYDQFPEWVIEHLGRFGVGGRLAVPRLKELRRHRNPWIRQWAEEAHARIMPTAKAVTLPPRQTEPEPPCQTPTESNGSCVNKT